jgi:hypothetical protein
MDRPWEMTDPCLLHVWFYTGMYMHTHAHKHTHTHTWGSHSLTQLHTHTHTHTHQDTQTHTPTPSENYTCICMLLNTTLYVVWGLIRHIILWLEKLADYVMLFKAYLTHICSSKDIFFKRHTLFNNILYQTTYIVIQHIWLIRHICPTTYICVSTIYICYWIL